MKYLLGNAAAALVFIALLEGGLRLRAHDAPAYFWKAGFGLHLKSKERRVFERAPENGGEKIPWETNSAGFRGPELKLRPGKRIVVYGDSNIQAQFSEEAKTYRAQLEKLLPDTEVINAGTLGTSPDQNLIRLREELPTLRPTGVVFHVFADNDFGDLIRNRLFRWDGAQLRRTSYAPSNDAALDEAENQTRGLQILKRLRSKLGKKPAPSPRLSPREEIEKALAQFEREWNAYLAVEPGLFRQFDDRYDFDLALQPHSARSQAKIELMEAVLKEAHAQCRKEGVDFLLLIEGSAVDLTENQRFTPSLLRLLSPDYDPLFLSTILERMAERNQIPYLNLARAFQSEGAQALYFHEPDYHWNDEGQKRAAELTALFWRGERGARTALPVN